MAMTPSVDLTARGLTDDDIALIDNIEYFLRGHRDWQADMTQAASAVAFGAASTAHNSSAAKSSTSIARRTAA